MLLTSAQIERRRLNSRMHCRPRSEFTQQPLPLERGRSCASIHGSNSRRRSPAYIRCLVDLGEGNSGCGLKHRPLPCQGPLKPQLTDTQRQWQPPLALRGTCWGRHWTRVGPGFGDQAPRGSDQHFVGLRSRSPEPASVRRPPNGLSLRLS